MTTKWEDTSWQEELLEMKTHKPQDIKLLIKEPKGLIKAWRIGSIHEEYKRLRKNKSQS